MIGSYNDLIYLTLKPHKPPINCMVNRGFVRYILGYYVYYRCIKPGNGSHIIYPVGYRQSMLYNYCINLVQIYTIVYLLYLLP